MPSIEVTISNDLDLPEDEFFTLCEDIFNEIVDTTPVDTGYAQSRWEFTMVNPNECFINNDCEYISYLEDGHSSQAPNGMVDVALQKFL